MSRVAAISTLLISLARGRADRSLSRLSSASRSGVLDRHAVGIAEQVAALDDLAGLTIGILVSWVAAISALAVVGASGRASRTSLGRHGRRDRLVVHGLAIRTKKVVAAFD